MLSPKCPLPRRLKTAKPNNKFQSKMCHVSKRSFSIPTYQRHFTFDPAKEEWKEVGFCRVVYPEPTCFVGDTSNDPPTRKPDDGYLAIIIDTEDEDYTSHYDHKKGGYGSCTYGYHARSTSPFSTRIWKMEPGEEEFHLVTLLPRRLNVFEGFKTIEMMHEKFKALPNAMFEDFSVVQEPRA